MQTDEQVISELQLIGQLRDLIREGLSCDSGEAGILNIATAAHTIAKAHYEQRIEAEREACAEVAEDRFNYWFAQLASKEAGRVIATAIRNRSSKQGE